MKRATGRGYGTRRLKVTKVTKRPDSAKVVLICLWFGLASFGTSLGVTRSHEVYRQEFRGQPREQQSDY